MSNKLYIGATVSYEEKGQWVYIVAIVLTYGGYVAAVLLQGGATPPPELDYVPLILWAIGIGIAISIGGRIVIEILKPSESYSTDVRDRDIDRLGEYVGGTVLGVAMLAPFALTLAKLDHFWIANAIYLAFVLGALVSTTVKLVAYRRGL